MGRPSKLNADVSEQIAASIRAGATIEVAAEAAGITAATFHDWMKRGTLPGKPNAPHRAFRELVDQARAEGEVALVGRIARASQNGSWAAAAWLLERRYPERWAKASERKKDGDDAKPVDPFAKLDELAPRRAQAAKSV